MKKLLYFSFGIALAGCASDASGPKRDETDTLKDKTSFCKAWANAACSDDVVDACQATDKDSCRVAQQAFCIDHVPDKYVSTNAEKCIAAVKAAYSDEQLNEIGIIDADPSGKRHRYAVAIFTRHGDSYWGQQAPFVEYASCVIYRAIAKRPHYGCGRR